MFNNKLLTGSFLAVALFLIPIVSSAQTNSVVIISGNGQIVCPGCEVGTQFYAPLVVQVNDTTGKAVVGTTVTWSVTESGFVTTVTSVTNSIGQASYTFVPPPLFGSSYVTAAIVASALGASASFVENTFLPSVISPTAQVFINLVPQTAPPALTGQVGTTGKTPVTVSVFTNFGPLPGAQVRLTSGGTNQPTVSCATQAGQQAGTILTDATGTAVCNPVFGGVIGTGSYSIVVGGNYTTFGPAPLTVTSGPAALIKVIGGDKQNVNPGALAPLALVAEVTDIGGNATSGATVKWSVTSGTATLTSLVTTSASNGQVSAHVTPTVAPVTVTVALTSNSAIFATFTVNINVVVTGVSIVSGNPQTANQGQPFPDPLIVQVNDNAIPVAGATVTFAVTPAGAATLSASSAVTNSQGQAQVTATAGDTPGSVSVVATVKAGANTFTQTFGLTVNHPGPLISSINNAASFVNGFVSPCSLATIFGTGLATGLQGVAQAFAAPQTQVANVTVTFDGNAAPILAVANVNGQETVSVQVPCETSAPAGKGTTTSQMVVTVNNLASEPFPVEVSQFSPGIFQSTQPDGSLIPILIGTDGVLVTSQAPARAGSSYRMFVTGLGQTTPPIVTNQFDPLLLVNGAWVPQALPIQASILVGINGGGAPVTWAGYAYDMVGVYEIDFEVPTGTPAGNIPFAVVVYEGSNTSYGNGTVIPIG